MVIIKLKLRKKKLINLNIFGSKKVIFSPIVCEIISNFDKFFE